MDDAGYWIATLDNAARMLSSDRTGGLTTEEAVQIGALARGAGEVAAAIEGRLRARDAGIAPCPRCGGEPMVLDPDGTVRLECEVCGFALRAEDIGVRSDGRALTALAVAWEAMDDGDDD